MFSGPKGGHLSKNPDFSKGCLHQKIHGDAKSALVYFAIVRQIVVMKSACDNSRETGKIIMYSGPKRGHL